MSGKYGYVDDAGKLRVVEYGANKHGFQPSGEGITVPAPTLVQLNEEPYDDEPVRPTAAKKPKTAKPQKPLFRGDVGSPDFGGAPVEPTGSELGNEAAWTVPSADELRNSFRLDASDDRPQAVVAKAPAPPANAHRVATDSARSGAARHKSLAPRPQQTVTAFAPEEPLPVSGSFRSVQDFDGRRSQVALSRSYQTSERVDDDEIPPRFQPAAAPSRRHPAAARPSQPDDKRLAASRQVRPGVLDQLVEQYALPESGSPATHSVSFGLDSWTSPLGSQARANASKF